MKLHEAIGVLLAERSHMYVPQLADEINRRSLYIRGDGKPLPSDQIYARVGNKTYRDRYCRDHLGRIYLAS